MSPVRSAAAKPASPPAPLILLVEAHALTRMAVAGYLRDCGYQVVEADGAAEAKRLLEAGVAPQVAFIDLDIKDEIDGFGLAQWIRAVRSDVKVLLTSGARRTAATAGDLCEQGPYLAKPYDHRDLESQIRRLLAT
ncbi:response regulator [Reyranella sp.]|uniref:response regulator n=1 Tax=Reyranella sp. TaxID=1929291 RepID=UPI003D0FC7EE